VNVEDSIGIVIVSYGHESEIKTLLKLLKDQIKQGDKIVVVDNHPDHITAKNRIVQKYADYVVKSENNGFSGGCRVGANKVINEVELLFFLNPDTRPEKNLLDEMRKGANTKYDAWMALLILHNNKINSAGTAVHISGLSWASGFDKRIESVKTNKDIFATSGACMMVRRNVWLGCDGMSDEFFMYYEDTDFSSRLFTSGHKIGLLPQAHVIHDYDFGKGTHKWFYLERNRHLYIIRTWPFEVILTLLPLLLISELGLIFVSIIQRRLKLKIKSYFSTFKLMPWAILYLLPQNITNYFENLRLQKV
jgi:GT2 family glycosyltransferase